MLRLERYAGNPILSPNPANAWESAVATNPGAWYDEAAGEVQMLYRAAGDDPEHRIYFGLATSRDGYHFERASDQPVFGPSLDGFDAGCVEDPRIVKIDDWYYLTYASRAFPPGRYWTSDKGGYAPPTLPPAAPVSLRANATVTGLALTQDFHTWIRAGRLTRPEVDDRDVILFPERIGGKFWMLHRPMDWCGPQYGTAYPAIWISSGDDLLCWSESTLLAKAELPWENRKIGGNTPPIRTELGWLTLYHAVGADRHYRLGALLLDLDDPRVVRYRAHDWLLQPEHPYELQGYYPGVCFPCGKVILDGQLFVYYGGADKYVGLATCRLDDLLADLERCPA
ncbi:MAG: hypothetical protein IT204_08320 [Fimbriimonadaceae bacterium]|nr:hypothetical protein [Fimbriimonadaceae bacterium]